jgi:hypothetical protein
MTSNKDIPLWIKISYTTLAIIIFPIYLYKYGAVNFLWFSDIAFFMMVPALWFKSRIISSMMAIGVLPIETIWLVSLFTGGAFLGIANYMYDTELPLWLRLLSFFHFAVIGAIIYMIGKFGYDKRALFPQIILSLIVVFLTRNFSDKVDNINMVFLPEAFSGYMSENFYTVAMPVALVFIFIIPTHFILKKKFMGECEIVG